MDRSGQVVVVLGASGGLGLGLSRRFAADGARLVIADIEETALEQAAAELESQGTQVIGVRTDVAKAEQVEALAFASLERFGHVDMVCNTVGVARGGTAWELTLDDWRWQVDVNFFGVVHVMHAFVPILLEQGHGHVVNTASTVALMSQAGNAGYLASKHAALSVCESVQQDLRAVGSAVRVSVLIPGAIRSRMYDGARNRQAEYGGRPVTSGGAQSSREYLEQYGADPDVLADILVTQLDEGRFYVFGRLEDVRYAELRLDDIRRGHLSEPSFVRVPGPGSRALLAKSNPASEG